MVKAGESTPTFIPPPSYEQALPEENQGPRRDWVVGLLDAASHDILEHLDGQLHHLGSLSSLCVQASLGLDRVGGSTGPESLYPTHASSLPFDSTAPLTFFPPGHTVCVVRGDAKISGTVTFEQASESDPTTISWDITGHDPNAQRGMHIHTFGDNTNGCTSAGPHCKPVPDGRFVRKTGPWCAEQPAH